jgi:hypothetical protein
MKQDVAAIGKSNGHGGLRSAGAKYLAPVILILVGSLWLSMPVVFAQSSSFTYQGRLQEGGTSANGSYDFQFALWDSANAGTGTQIGTTQTVSNVAVSSGVFTVQLDFGATAFSGANRFLEIAVRIAGSGAFVTLAPRHRSLQLLMRCAA